MQHASLKQREERLVFTPWQPCEQQSRWNLLESTAPAFSNNNRSVWVTSGVQTGGSLAAVQLPLLDLEVRTGPFQACVAPQFGEELLHGPLIGPAAAHRCSHFPYTDAAAAAAASAATSASVQGS